MVYAPFLFLNGAIIAQETSKWAPVIQWLLSHGIRIVLIIAIYIVAIFVVRYITKRFVRLVEEEGRTTPDEREKRAKTIMGVINTTSMVVLGVFAAFMVLREFNVNITPLLTGAGIIGIAVGFAAQSVIKDFVQGFFILAENQLRVGDVVEVAGHAGVVERITMRTTRLRSLDGHVHTVPNGEISVVENMTHGWSRALVDIGVAYKEDIDHVIAVVEDTAAKLRNEKRFKDVVIDDPEVLGVQELGDSAITIRLMLKTQPMRQWEIKRELYRRLKKRFDEEGISIPFPQLRLHGELSTRTVS